PGVTAIHNTVVNATGTGIAAESAVGTVLAWNLVYDNYPGTKVIGTDYPRGLQTDWYANGSVVLVNVIHTVHWGIVVGADGGIFALNSLTDVDYGIYVLDAGAWTGVSTSGETIFATSYAGVANTAIRLPANFQGTVIDVGPGIRTSDLTALKLATLTAATRIAADQVQPDAADLGRHEPRRQRPIDARGRPHRHDPRGPDLHVHALPRKRRGHRGAGQHGRSQRDGRSGSVVLFRRDGHS